MAINKFLVLGGLGIMTFGATGCGGGGGGLVGQSNPRIRVFDAVDGQSSVTLAFTNGGNTLATSPAANLGQPNTASDLIMNNGNAAAQIVASTGGILGSGQSNLYQVNKKYTVIAAGKTTYTTITLNDSQSTTDGQHIAVRVADGAQVAGPIDVYLLPNGQTAPQPADIPTFSNLQYGSATTSGNNAAVNQDGYLLFTITNSVNLNVVITAAGTKTPVVVLSAITVVPGAYYTIVAFDAASGPSTALLIDKR